MSTTAELSPQQLWERWGTVMALNRGIEALDEFAVKSRETTEHSVAKREQYLADLYLQTHEKLFQDTRGHPSDNGRAGVITDAEKREAFRLEIGQLVKGLFDNNGFVPKHESLAKVLAPAYVKLRELAPFEYGNNETLNLFMVMLSRLPAVKEVYPHEIDFRRLRNGEADALLACGEGKVADALEKAMDPTRSQGLPNKPNELHNWPSKEFRIAGIPLVKYQLEEKDYLVLANGGLIELNENVQNNIETRLNESDALLTDIRFEPQRYLPGIDDKSGDNDIKQKTFIDGIPVNREGESPLLCLDLNPITGLRPPAHHRFEQFFDQQLGRDEATGEKRNIFYLHNNPGAVAKLKEGAPEDLQHMVEVACAGIDAATIKLDAACDTIFRKTKAKKVENGQKHFVFSMGGAGAGKTQAEKLMQAYAGDAGYVKASLDEARYYSDTYKVLCAADHHADDYITVEPFASTLRNWVATRAKEQGCNLLYDGTGIAYKGRYDSLTSKYHRAGYKTTVCAIDTMLDAPPGREGEYWDNSLRRVVERYKGGHDRRALPWPVVVGKHTKVMTSFMDAINDQFVDKAVLLSTDGPKGSAYVVAETFDFDRKEKMPETLRSAMNNGNDSAGGVKSKLHDMMRENDSSILKIQAQADKTDKTTVDDLISRIPDVENNAGFVARRVAGKDRVLAINNVIRLIDLAEKGLLNPHASGPSNLSFKREDLAFDLPVETRRDEGDSSHRLVRLRPEQIQAYLGKILSASPPQLM